MPAYYPEGNRPLREDYTERSLQKINALIGSNQSEWDEIELTYAGSNISKVVYKLGGATVETREFTYTGSNLTKVIKS